LKEHVNNPAYIITLAHNRLQLTHRTFAAVMSHDPGHPFQWIFVDNGSTDGTLEYLESIAGGIHSVITLNENRGISYGTNIGWHRAAQEGAAYFMRIDNDMAPTRDGWLHELVQICDAVPGSVVAGHNVEPVSFPIGSMGGVDVQVKSVGNVGGGCLMVPRRTFDRLGYLYPFTTALYGEDDAEYSSRVRADGGSILYAARPGAFIHGGELESPGYREFKDFQRQRALIEYGHRMEEIRTGNLYVGFSAED
jgi:GT2 family glycosyltransferase